MNCVDYGHRNGEFFWVRKLLNLFGSKTMELLFKCGLR